MWTTPRPLKSPYSALNGPFVMVTSSISSGLSVARDRDGLRLAVQPRRPRPNLVHAIADARDPIPPLRIRSGVHPHPIGGSQADRRRGDRLALRIDDPAGNRVLCESTGGC